MNWNWHKNKAIIREFALPEKPIKNSIWLPAQNWLCVSAALNKGLLNKSQNIIAVEQDKATFAEMQQNAPKHKALRCLHQKLENLIVDCPIDYCYLDFLGGISAPIAKWMEQDLSRHLVPQATVVITQIYAWRGSKIIPQQEGLIFEKDGWEVSRRYESFFGEIDRHTKCLLILIHRIFNQWDFNIEVDDQNHLPAYRDLQHKMMLFKLIDFMPAKKVCFSPLFKTPS